MPGADWEEHDEQSIWVEIDERQATDPPTRMMSS
jgi:hypothetical protein